MPQKENFSRKEAITFGYETVKKNLGFFLKIMALMIAASLITNLALEKVVDVNPVLGWLLYFFGLALTILFSIGWIKINLKFYDQEKLGLNDLFNYYHLLFRYFIAYMIYMIIVLFGLIFLIVPGIILAVRYCFYAYYLIDKDYGPIKALAESSALTQGKRWEIFVFLIFLGAINLLGFLFFFVGLIFTLPITALAVAYVFRKLSEEKEFDHLKT